MCYRQKHWTVNLEGPRLVHSKRRNKLHQTLVEKLVHSHENLVLTDSLDDSLHHLLLWDIEFIIDESEKEPEC